MSHSRGEIEGIPWISLPGIAREIHRTVQPNLARAFEHDRTRNRRHKKKAENIMLTETSNRRRVRTG